MSPWARHTEQNRIQGPQGRHDKSRSSSFVRKDHKSVARQLVQRMILILHGDELGGEEVERTCEEPGIGKCDWINWE